MVVQWMTDVNCTHCRLPVPTGLVRPEADEQFCCHGCESAYQLIHASGLDSFYDLVDSNQQERSLQGRTSPSGAWSEFDDPVFLEKFSKQKGHSRETTLVLEGMHCAACLWLLEKLPVLIPGVFRSIVNWPRSTVNIAWNPDVVSLSNIAETLDQLGYTPHPMRESQRATQFKLENRKHLSKLGVAIALAGNNMILSAALYLGMFSAMATDISHLLRIASCVVGLASLVIPGRVFLVNAWRAVKSWTPHMDLPIALALLAGSTVGTWNAIRGVGEIYFDTLSVLIALLLVGRWLQFRQQARAADAIEMLYRLTPRSTFRLENGTPVETRVELIEVGDVLEIRSGMLVPADGRVISGVSHIDESLLTGESISVRKKQGDLVAAGTANQESVFRMEVTAAGGDTRISQISELVEQSSLGKPEVVQWANRIGGYFVLIAIGLALTTFFYWLPSDSGKALERTIALLIVACPCALALATPLCISVAIGRAAKSGIMIKGGDVLQLLQKPGMIWLDKTGTLTEGEMKVQRWHGETRCIPLIGEIERKSNHPVARAIVSYCNHWCPENDPTCQLQFAAVLAHPIEIRELAGRGLCASTECCEVLIGNEKLLSDNSIFPNPLQIRLADKIAEQGFSPCWVAIDGRIVALLSISDAIRPEAAKAIDSLQSRHWKVGILSGDHQAIVDRVAKRLGIAREHAKGNMAPEAKLRSVQDPQKTIVMVGDGVNDSAALAGATVGIAVKSGAETSLAAAPVYLASPGLDPILKLFAISDSAARLMRLNLGISLAYNLTFAGLAFAGWINPLIAAVLMPVSSLTVVSLSLLAGRTRTL